MGVQVRELTYSGEEHLSATSRSFISFKWGERDIEEFNLIITYGDRLSKGVYSGFEDITTTLEGKDGQLFWKSYYKPNELSFTLSTDGMSAREMEDFKQYFKPGFSRKFILSEYPNRYTEARVAAAPTIEMIPFEEKVTFKGREIRTTTYKGDISISFIMDDPYWYAVDNIMEGELTEDQLHSMYEDGIPALEDLAISTGYNLILGGNKYYNGALNNNYTSIQPEIAANDNLLKVLSSTSPTTFLYNSSTGPVKQEMSFSFSTVPVIWRQASDTEPSNTITVRSAASLPDENSTIIATVYPETTSLGDSVISIKLGTEYINNTYKIQWQQQADEEWIDIEGANETIYNGTTENVYRAKVDIYDSSNIIDTFSYYYPSCITALKNAIKIVEGYANKDGGVSTIDLRTDIRDTITHRTMRNKIYSYLSELISNKELTIGGEAGYGLRKQITTKLESFAPTQFAVYFNSKSGISKVWYKNPDDETEIIEENAGDMVCSEYLIIGEHNSYNPGEKVTEAQCFSVQSSNQTLYNFKLDYKYTYV